MDTHEVGQAAVQITRDTTDDVGFPAGPGPYLTDPQQGCCLGISQPPATKQVDHGSCHGRTFGIGNRRRKGPGRCLWNTLKLWHRGRILAFWQSLSVLRQIANPDPILAQHDPDGPQEIKPSAQAKALQATALKAIAAQSQSQTETMLDHAREDLPWCPHKTGKTKDLERTHSRPLKTQDGPKCRRWDGCGTIKLLCPLPSRSGHPRPLDIRAAVNSPSRGTGLQGHVPPGCTFHPSHPFYLSRQ